MPPRQKKLILVLAALPFLFLYAVLVLAIYEVLPKNRLVELVFFVLVGSLWAFPLKPVMIWANRPVD